MNDVFSKKEKQNSKVKAKVEEIAQALNIHPRVLHTKLFNASQNYNFKYYEAKRVVEATVDIRIGDLAEIVNKSYMYIFDIIHRAGLFETIVVPIEDVEKKELPQTLGESEYTRNELEEMSYKELQQIAKAKEINARQKKVDLIKQIAE